MVHLNVAAGKPGLNTPCTTSYAFLTLGPQVL